MKQELLAPAGNLEAGYAAICYGADAVYLGLRKFSARAGAENFGEDELDTFTAYAHAKGCKVYAAINTLLQESELQELLQQLDICSRCKIDAVILQDLGVARIIRESYPELELHASTQMAVHNKEGALFLQKQGFSRIVLARELTLTEIQEIASIEGLETEAFIHGALCYSYSGLCQFSAMELGRSANRGKCMYPCRSCFKNKVTDKHLFSMKDMALRNQVLQMPVTSLKIEGRKKSPLYVAAVTDYYRRILDGKGEDFNRAENIRQIFSRPWCKFHFNGKDKNIIDADFVGHRGLPIGKIEKIVQNRIFVTIKHELGRHDGLQIDVLGMEKPFGFSVQNLRVNGKAEFAAPAGSLVEITLPPKAPQLQKNMPVYLASSGAVKGAYPISKPKPDEYLNTFAIDVMINVVTDKLQAVCGKFVAEIKGEFAPAKQPEKINEAFRIAFAKTGGTSLCLQNLQINNLENLFVPVSMMNELRRKLYEQIKPETKHGKLPMMQSVCKFSKQQWIIKTDDVSNLALLDLEKFAEVVVLLNPNMSPEDIKCLPQDNVRLALPAVCRHVNRFSKVVKSMLQAGYNKWEVANYWALEFLPINEIDITFDSSLYTMNTQAISEAQKIGAKRVTLPIEDTLENIKTITQNSPLPTVLVVYQDAPLFISAACIRDNDCVHCSGGEQWINLEKDGQKYQAFSKDCQIMLFNQAPFCIAAETSNVKTAFRRMDFCYKKYTPEQVRKTASLLFAGENVRYSRKGNINNTKI